MEVTEKQIMVGTMKVNVIQIPCCISDYQLLLCNNIKEIMGVCYRHIDREHITWKFGKPTETFIKELENKIRELYPLDK